MFHYLFNEVIENICFNSLFTCFTYSLLIRLCSSVQCSTFISTLTHFLEAIIFLFFLKKVNCIICLPISFLNILGKLIMLFCYVLLRIFPNFLTVIAIKNLALISMCFSMIGIEKYIKYFDYKKGYFNRFLNKISALVSCSIGNYLSLIFVYVCNLFLPKIILTNICIIFLFLSLVLIPKVNKRKLFNDPQINYREEENSFRMIFLFFKNNIFSTLYFFKENFSFFISLLPTVVNLYLGRTFSAFISLAISSAICLIKRNARIKIRKLLNTNSPEEVVEKNTSFIDDDILKISINILLFSTNLLINNFNYFSSRNSNQVVLKELILLSAYLLNNIYFDKKMSKNFTKLFKEVKSKINNFFNDLFSKETFIFFKVNLKQITLPINSICLLVLTSYIGSFINTTLIMSAINIVIFILN